MLPIYKSQFRFLFLFLLTDLNTYLKTSFRLGIIIKSNRIVTPGGIKPGFVIIKDGLIVDVADSVPDTAVQEIIDVGDSVVMSGVIDPHVHINEPGRTNWEGFNTATKAALAGGITTLVDMPLNSSPVTTGVKAFDEKIAATTNQLHTNCGFWGGIVPGNENEVEGLIEKGVLGFKAFLTHSGIDEFPNATETDLRKVMPVIAAKGLPLLVHCELTDNVERANDDNRSYQNYLASRPGIWEDNAVAMMIRLCGEFDCRVHIVHLSSANAIEQIRQAKQRGLPLMVETGQHYLYFNAEDIPDGRTEYKCAPPLREKENNDLLWKALEEGVIDFVATDHSPSTPSLKELESGDLLKAWGGIASLQFALPVLWTAAKQRGIGLTNIAKWLCENPAKLIGKTSSKGKIAKGYDADLVVWNPEGSFIVTEEIIQHRHKVTPYLQEQLYGVVEQTFLNGHCVFNKGSFIELNRGKIITNS
jgi:allantoinase